MDDKITTYDLKARDGTRFLVYTEEDVEKLKNQYDIVEVVKREL